MISSILQLKRSGQTLWMLLNIDKFYKNYFKKIEMVIGYTTGVFDLFHIDHLNILKKASSKCDKLIVNYFVDWYSIKERRL